MKRNNVIRATEILGTLPNNKEEIEEIIISKWQDIWERSRKSSI